MEQLALKFEDLESVLIGQGIRESFNNKKVEIVKPLPLEDLLYMMDAISEGYESKKTEKLDDLGRGAFGTVLGYKDYAIKYFRSGKSKFDDASRSNDLPECDKLTDAYILKELQPIPSIPRIYAVIDDTAIIMERVHGDTCERYQTKVRNSKYKGNYISKDFNKVYRKALEEIVNLGFEPYDLHGDNVMICKHTGLPKIVDVGLFRKIKKQELKEMYESDEKFDMTPMRQAIEWVADSMHLYIDRKSNPKKWKEIDLKNEIERAENEAYREKMERAKQERAEARLKDNMEEFVNVEKQYNHINNQKGYIRKVENKPQFRNQLMFWT